MERRDIMVYCGTLNFDHYSGSMVKLKDFLEDIREGIPEEYRDSIHLSFEATKDYYDDDEIIIRVSYARPETDEEMEIRMEREREWKRREEEAEAKAEKERQFLAAQKEEKERQQYLALHAKYGK